MSEENMPVEGSVWINPETGEFKRFIKGVWVPDYEDGANPEEEKVCINCKWCLKTANPPQYFCTKELSTEVAKHALVVGRQAIIDSYENHVPELYSECYLVRGNPYRCGITAQWFEPRVPNERGAP